MAAWTTPELSGRNQLFTQLLGSVVRDLDSGADCLPPPSRAQLEGSRQGLEPSGDASLP